EDSARATDISAERIAARGMSGKRRHSGEVDPRLGSDAPARRGSVADRVASLPAHMQGPHTPAAQHRDRTALDPVCGMRVEPSSARGGALVHGGVEYAFCSPHCRSAFEAEPARYLGPPGSSLAPDSAARGGRERGEGEEGEKSQAGAWRSQGTTYVCPMHPEVEQDGPGDCPLCGMALELKVARAEEPANAELASMTRRFRVSLALAVPTLALAMGEMIPGLAGRIPPGPAAWLQLA